MTKQKQKRQTNPISFRSTKASTAQLAELSKIDGDNKSSIILKAIDYYYNYRITVTKTREQT